MSEKSAEKKALRRALREKASALTDEYRLAADAAIRRAVLESDLWRDARSVFAYVSMRTEPDTRALLDDALSAGKALYVPLCRADGTMEAVRIHATAELRPGLRDIPEPPADAERLGDRPLDLALVPCVSVTRDGYRLGHGAGYYDRFLAGHPCRTLCLCYEELLSATVPTDGHDVRMDAVATENGIF